MHPLVSFATEAGLFSRRSGRRRPVVCYVWWLFSLYFCPTVPQVCCQLCWFVILGLSSPCYFCWCWLWGGKVYFGCSATIGVVFVFFAVPPGGCIVVFQICRVVPCRSSRMSDLSSYACEPCKLLREMFPWASHIIPLPLGCG